MVFIYRGYFKPHNSLCLKMHPKSVPVASKTEKTSFLNICGDIKVATYTNIYIYLVLLF